MQQESTLNRPRLSLKVQTLASLSAIAAAVILPQIFHMLGTASGIGSALGETLLPMHLPVLLVGLLAGSWAGAAAGLLSPSLSFALSGMPGIGILPFMTVELCVYGLCAGLLRQKNMPVILKVLAAQLVGRAVRAAAILLSFYGFGSQAVSPSVIWTSITAGLFGLLLQWVLLPLIVYRVQHAERK